MICKLKKNVTSANYFDLFSTIPKNLRRIWPILCFVKWVALTVKRNWLTSIRICTELSMWMMKVTYLGYNGQWIKENSKIKTSFQVTHCGAVNSASPDSNWHCIAKEKIQLHGRSNAFDDMDTMRICSPSKLAVDVRRVKEFTHFVAVEPKVFFKRFKVTFNFPWMTHKCRIYKHCPTAGLW